jgi:pheromone shutdown protein TraB
MVDPTKLHQETGLQPAVTARSAWTEAAASGIDMTLIEQTLRLTVWERMVEHQRALERVRMFQGAKIRRDG